LSSIEQLVRSLRSSPPFPARWLADDQKAWNDVLAAAAQVPLPYTPSFLRYQQAYVAEHAAAYFDLSLVATNAGQPVAVWPLSIHQSAAGWQLTTQEGPVRPPLFRADTPEKTRKRVSADCLDWIDRLGATLGVTQWTSVEPLRDNDLDHWHRQLMERGAQAALTHGLAVDLTRPLEEIRLNFRKSYRPLITKGLATWKVAILESARTPVFDEFRELHREVAGRVTRSLETWELQHEALARGEAFLVTLRDDAERLVGAGYFHVSCTDGLYAVGVYDRTLFEMPLGHVVQFKAIEHMQRRGLRWYYIGARAYPADRPTPSEKELSIARFKEGFATTMFPQLVMTCPIGAPAPSGNREQLAQGT
jgi:FemAB family protein